MLEMPYRTNRLDSLIDPAFALSSEYRLLLDKISRIRW